MKHKRFMYISAKILDSGMLPPKQALRLIKLRKVIRATPFYARRRVWRYVWEFMSVEPEIEPERVTSTPAKIGQTVYILLDDYGIEDAEELISAETITEVGTRGFWLSGSLDDPEGMDILIRWERIGVDVFFTRKAAEKALKERT